MLSGCALSPEAGVLFGGISIYMAALLRASGQLGRPRKMILADSFAGLPPASYKTLPLPAAHPAEAALGRWGPGAPRMGPWSHRA